jgi:hypothetical protein
MKLLQIIRRSIEYNYLPKDWHSQKTKFIIIGEWASLKDITAVYDTYNREWILKASSVEAIFFQEIIRVRSHSAVWIHNYNAGEVGKWYLINEENLEHYGIIKCEFNAYALPEQTTVIGTIRYANSSLYYWQSDGSYRLEAECEDHYDEDEILFEYHTKSRIENSKYARFRVGFEIEKEDDDIKDDIDAEYYYNKHQFIFERDGSLEEGGFELVSPTFNLFDKKLIERFYPVSKYVNAEYSENCGGHIHLSLKGHSGIELFKRIIGWLPLLYAMYPKRIHLEYCKADCSEIIINDRPRGAINILDNRVELRIFSAVQNMSTLRFRIALLRLMANNLDISSEDLMLKMINKKSSIYKHFTASVYLNSAKYSALLDRFQDFTYKYEHHRLSESTILAMQKFNHKNNSILCASSF